MTCWIDLRDDNSYLAKFNYKVCIKHALVAGMLAPWLILSPGAAGNQRIFCIFSI